jgi:hypothetical protein
VGALVLLAAACLFAAPARAEEPACTLDAVDVFPAAGSVVPTNVRFHLEGFGPRAAQLRKLIGKSLILASGSTRVTLAVRSAFTAGNDRVAVELVPGVALDPGKEWRLDLSRVLPMARLRDGREVDVLTWSTGSGADRSAPTFKRAPTVEQGALSEGQRQVTFRVSLDELTPSLLEAKVRLARGGPTRRYFVPVRGGRVVLGDATCGGLALERGRAYFVSFSAIDSAGQKSPELPRIEFNAPRGGNP